VKGHRLHRRRIERVALAVAAVAFGILVGHAATPRTAASAPAADTLRCDYFLERRRYGALAMALVVHVFVPVDTASIYAIEAQLCQDRAPEPVSYANDRGYDMSGPEGRRGRPVEARAARDGRLPVTLWFPGSEIRHRAHPGGAWVEVQVSRRFAPSSGAPRTAPAPRRYRCLIDEVNPISFVAQLPGQGIPPALPEPAPK
jgi:hypothetical protein